MLGIILPVSANFHRTLPPYEFVFVEAVTVTDVVFLALCENTIYFTH